MVKSSYLAILLLLLFVASGYAAPFTSHGDGTVTDDVTKLMWQQQDDNTTKSWQKALDDCNELTLGGYTDWRLPNKKELESIVDYAQFNPSIDVVFIGTESSYHWSSTSGADDPSHAWFVSFSGGYVGSYGKTSSLSARCVR